MRFPRSEANISALMEQILDGLIENPTVFPNLPVDVATLTQLRDDYRLERSNASTAQGNARVATAVKDDKLEDMVDAMKIILRYCEALGRQNPAILALLGWALPSESGPPEPPGQPRTLEVQQEGTNYVNLDWKKPVDGGTVAHYRVERRMPDGNPWQFAHEVYELNAHIPNQPRGVQLAYRVIANNRHGDSPPSNTVTAVL